MELSGDFGDQQHPLVISCHAATGCVCGGDRLVPSPSPRAASVIVTNFPTPLGHFAQDFPPPGEDCDMPGTRVTLSNVAGQSQPGGGLAQGKQQLRVTFTEVEANLILLGQTQANNVAGILLFFPSSQVPARMNSECPRNGSKQSAAAALISLSSQ